MSTVRIKFPVEYQRINNSRLSLELGHAGSWLRERLSKLPATTSRDNREESEAEGREIVEINTALLAAERMAAIASDLERNAVEAKTADSAWKRISAELQPAWGFCKQLAAKCSSPPTARNLYQSVRDLCKKHTGKNGYFAPCQTRGNRHDLLRGNNKKIRTFLGHAIWLTAWDTLRKMKMSEYAEQLLLNCWNHYAVIEQAATRPTRGRLSIHRAHASYALAHHYYDLRERASAARWVLLTFIHDVSTGHFRNAKEIKWDSTGATNFLRSRFGISEERLRHLYREIRAIESSKNPKNWSKPLLRHPEYILALLLAKPQTQSVVEYFPPELRCQPGSRIQHPISEDVLRAFWAAKSVADHDTNAKGEWLEHLVTYLFSTLEGFRVRKRHQPADQTSEVDLLVDVLPAVRQKLDLPFAGRIAVECKNWTSVVNVPVLQQLVGKMKNQCCDVGIVVSRMGFTETVRDFARWQGEKGRVLLLDRESLKTKDFLTTLLKLSEDQWDRRQYKGVETAAALP